MASYADKIRRTADRAKNDIRDNDIAYRAACYTNIAIAVDADYEIEALRSALKNILDVDEGIDDGHVVQALQMVTKIAQEALGEGE